MGAVTSWNFDHIGRITRQQTQTGTANITSDYTFGNTLAGTPAVYLASLINSVNGIQVWGYTLSRTLLGQVNQQSGNGLNGTQYEWSPSLYDARGRLILDSDHYQTSSLLASTIAPTSTPGTLPTTCRAESSGWTYNSSNQVTGAPPVSGAPSLGGATGLGYDASGNLSALTAARSVGTAGAAWPDLSVGNVSYTYDFAGRRVSKTVAGATTFFLYADGALIAELDSNGNITRSYNWGPQGLISDTSSGVSRFYFYDGVGNTRMLLNASGTVITDAAYAGWGAVYSASYLPTPFGWKGQSGAYRDSESGLFLMGARYYSPALGRFVGRDPIAFAGGINVYSYCGGDPINYTDPERTLRT